MDRVQTLWIVAAGVLVLNLPFGFWRAGARKFSTSWFCAVHAPVPLVVLLRIYSGQGFHLTSFALVVGAFLAGQALGGRLRVWLLGRM